MKFNSKIGIGTVQFGVTYGISNTTGQTLANEVSTILATALLKGVRIIDTAPAYGIAEEVLGKHDLTKFRIVSKFMPPAEKETITKQLQDSLKKLNLNTIYGYLAHRPESLAEDKDQWNELQSLKRNGKVEKIGFSLNSPNELELLLKIKMIPDLVQVPYNYFDSRFKNHIIQLKNLGCEVHSRSAFLQGLFFVNVDKLPSFFDQVKNDLKNLQLKYNSELPALLLKYVKCNTFIDHIIIGVENEKQLMDALKKNSSKSSLAQYNKTVSELILMPVNWPQN
jgi:aryl-alcohol dehydrogenase-like predicted oxidoreductase